MHVDSALLRRIAKQFISCVNLDIHEACEALLFVWNEFYLQM